MDRSRTDALIADLDHPDKPTIRTAVEQLIHLAVEFPQLQELLERRLTEAGHSHYWPVAYILGHLQPPPAYAVEVLIETLDHREPDIRWAVGLLLTNMAKTESAIVDRLVRLTAAGSINQKRMALYCIRDLALSDVASRSALLAALGDADATVRVAAAICLRLRTDLEAVGKQALLKIYAEDVEAKVRHTAAIALAHLGDATPEFLSALRKNRESDDRETRKAARAALDLLEKRRSASSGSASDR